MTRLLHMRGDITGMFLIFTLLFLGIWQLVVAWKKLNGFSLTGYPDRRELSIAIGIAMIAGACCWYYSRPGHFTSPDVEGIETLLLLACGFLAATAVQGVLSSVAFRRRYRDFVTPPPQSSPTRGEEVVERYEEVTVSVAGSTVRALYGPPAVVVRAAAGVLLLHDYGGDKRDLHPVAARLRAGGHSTLSVDLDGHGNNPREIVSPEMEALMDGATALLKEKTGEEAVFAVGLGLGGTLAIRLAARDPSVERAVALDPPAVEPGGYPAVNAGRELKPGDLAAAFLRPAARREGGGRISLSRLLELMPPPCGEAGETVTVIGTAETWFNSPSALRGSLASLGIGDVTLLAGSHSSIACEKETLETIAEALS